MESTADAIINTLISTDDEKNLCDVVTDLAANVEMIANAITPYDAAPGKDATGGHISSLTESVMGVTSGLCSIAEAINNLAEAVRESKR